jgi:hypothetical protein
MATNQVDHTPTPRAEALFGFWIGVVTAVLGTIALAMAVTNPPRSGPYCSISCIEYPYTNAAAFVPRDYLWMYPAALLALAFVVLVTCVHRYARDDLKSFSLVALCFASLGATMILSDYIIQIAVVQPSLLDGQVNGLSLFSQHNPHGIFIALENGGYALMGLAFLFTGLSIDSLNRLERIVRRLLIIGAVVVIGLLLSFSAVYGKNLGYHFEVLALVIDWIVLIFAGVLLGVVFKRLIRASGPGPHPRPKTWNAIRSKR